MSLNYRLHFTVIVLSIYSAVIVVVAIVIIIRVPFYKKYFIYITFSANYYKLLLTKIAQLYMQERNKQEDVSQVLLTFNSQLQLSFRRRKDDACRSS